MFECIVCRFSGKKVIAISFSTTDKWGTSGKLTRYWNPKNSSFLEEASDCWTNSNYFNEVKLDFIEKAGLIPQEKQY